MKLKLQNKKNPKINLQTYKECDATIMAASQSELDPFHKLVFFNPAMKFNRTASLLIAKTYQSMFGEGLAIDGLCATGARGIRYFLEAGIQEMMFIDANPIAIEVCKKNLKLNKIKAKTQVIDFNLLGGVIETPAKIIEVDAFGSTVPFLQTAIASIDNGGLLGITATDYAQLAGARVAPCIRHYDATPYNCHCGHEIGTRILLGKIAKTAAIADKAILPICTFFNRHAGRAMCITKNSATLADSMLQENIGYAYFCTKCKNQGVVNKKKICDYKKCPECDEKLTVAGPLWIGKTINSEMVEKSRKTATENEDESYKQSEKMFATIIKENELDPLFFDAHQLCSWAKLPIPNFSELELKLKESGFKFSRTHYSPTGFKTNAKVLEITKILRK